MVARGNFSTSFSFLYELFMDAFSMKSASKALLTIVRSKLDEYGNYVKYFLNLGVRVKNCSWMVK